jgi:hypothetical protein
MLFKGLMILVVIATLALCASVAGAMKQVSDDTFMRIPGLDQDFRIWKSALKGAWSALKFFFSLAWLRSIR